MPRVYAKMWGGEKRMTVIMSITADPITKGHVDIARRASRLFDKVIVALGCDIKKQHTFSVEERVCLATKALKSLPNVEITSYEFLTVDYLLANNVKVMIRGVRDLDDFRMESLMFDINKSLSCQDIELVMLPSTLKNISSSAVKEIIRNYGDVSDYVPLAVKQALEERVNEQYIIGVSGEFGAGKSYVTDAMVDTLYYTYGIKACNIDLDTVAHTVLNPYNRLPLFIDTRAKILETFGTEAVKADEDEWLPIAINAIDTKRLAEIVFSDKAKKLALESIIGPAVMYQFKEEIKKKKGVIFFNTAILAECDLANICNNNVIFIKCDRQLSGDRLIANRAYEYDEIIKVRNSQLSYEDKIKYVKDLIEKSGNGQIWEIVNDNSLFNNLTPLLENIIRHFRIMNTQIFLTKGKDVV